MRRPTRYHKAVPPKLMETGIFRKRVRPIIGNLLSIAGGIVTVATLIVMLTSAWVRHWVKENPYLVFGGFVAAVVAILVLLNIMRRNSERYAELRRLQSSELSRRAGRDKHAMDLVLNRIPTDGAIIRWLKQDFNPS